jgi:transposase-like protein
MARRCGWPSRIWAARPWRAVLDDLVQRGRRKPEFLIVDGGTGLEALAAL